MLRLRTREFRVASWRRSRPAANRSRIFPSRLVNYSTNDLLYVNAIVPTPLCSPFNSSDTHCSVSPIFHVVWLECSCWPILILIKASWSNDRSTTFRHSILDIRKIYEIENNNFYIRINQKQTRWKICKKIWQLILIPSDWNIIINIYVNIYQFKY